jgi:hypothetical protein
MENLGRFNFVGILTVIGTIMLIGLALSLLLLAWVYFKVRKINLPAGTDFFDALRATPLIVVILLDLLDLSMDFFSAPFSWVLLGRLGLEPLRTVTIVESLIPGTELLPTMTIAWIIATKIDKHGVLQSRIQHFIEQYPVLRFALMGLGKRKANRRVSAGG